MTSPDLSLTLTADVLYDAINAAARAKYKSRSPIPPSGGWDSCSEPIRRLYRHAAHEYVVPAATVIADTVETQILARVELRCIEWETAAQTLLDDDQPVPAFDAASFLLAAATDVRKAIGLVYRDEPLGEAAS